MREDLIRSLPEEDRQPGSKFREGDRIKARYQGETTYYPGNISCVNSDGTYDIEFDDGDKEVTTLTRPKQPTIRRRLRTASHTKHLSENYPYPCHPLRRAECKRS